MQETIDALIKEELQSAIRAMVMEGCSDKEKESKEREDDEDRGEDEEDDEELKESEVDALHSILVDGSVYEHLMYMEGVDHPDDLSVESQELAESVALAALTAAVLAKPALKKGKQRELQDQIDSAQRRIAILRQKGGEDAGSRIQKQQARIAKWKKEIAAMKTLGQGKSGWIRPSHDTVMRKRQEKQAAMRAKK